MPESSGSRNVFAMNIEALKTEVQSLSIDERRKLMAFMLALKDEKSTVKNHAHAAHVEKEEDYFPVRKSVERPCS